jgi:hypothetical protein
MARTVAIGIQDFGDLRKEVLSDSEKAYYEKMTSDICNARTA